MIGALPTSTSVELRLPTGTATIPGATSRSAGVMTARQAEVLEALELAQQNGGGAAGTALVPFSAPVDLSKHALRSDLMQVAGRLAVIERSGSRSETTLIAPDVSQIEREIAALKDTANHVSSGVIAACDEVQTLALRNADLESRVHNLEETLRGLAERMMTIAGEREAA